MSVSRRRALRRIGGFAAAGAVVLATPRLVRAAVDGRRLGFRNIHNDERLEAVFWRDGAYDPIALQDIDVILRDWRNDQVRPIDRALIELLYELARRTGNDTPYEVISAYRSATTNAMLATQSNGVASKSLHLDAKAIDIALPGTDLVALRDTAWAMQQGGVGYYAGSFIHVDTGRVRRWNF